MAMPTTHVQEMQGLYGPFTLAERVVQKIWLRRDFIATGVRLQDGRELCVRSSGTWNLLGGPDFRDARLLIDGCEIVGDVEVHFHASEWWAHGHDADPAYERVALHVVLFPPADAAGVAATRSGRRLPTLVLLPLLHRSLEEYASDEALERITERDTAERLADLARLPPPELRRTLLAQAEARWRQKEHYASLRIQRLGWVEAAHHTALEILGYRQNRAPMLTIASRHPLAEWGRGLDVSLVYREQGTDWQGQGVRPANHPYRRLQQYAAWVNQVPDWPHRLAGCLAKLPVPAGAVTDSQRVRRAPELGQLRRHLAQQLTGGVLNGTRFDNLVCDGLLPLAAARGESNLFKIWFHWFVGDAPPEIRRGMVTLGLSGPRAGPQTHGWAQGLLGWLIGQKASASG